MRSVAVVLPASICAMIPMFRQRFRGIVRATATLPCGLLSPRFSSVPRPTGGLIAPGNRTARLPLFSRRLLPAVVRERLVGLSHAMNVFLLLHRCAASIGRIKQLIAELVDHALFATTAAVGDEPADRERGAAVWIHFDWHLVVGAAHATGLYFKQRLAVLNGLLEQLDGLFATAP